MSSLAVRTFLDLAFAFFSTRVFILGSLTLSARYFATSAASETGWNVDSVDIDKEDLSWSMFRFPPAPQVREAASQEATSGYLSSAS